MTERLAERVVARFADLGLDTRQVRRVDIDSRKLLPREVLDRRDGNKRPVARDLAHDLAAFVVAERDQPGQSIEGAFDIVGLFRHQDDPIVAPIVRELDTESIENAPAPRRQEPQVDAVLIGQHLVLGGLNDLEVVEPADQHSQQRGLAASEQRRAPGKRLVSTAITLHAGFMRRRCARTNSHATHG